MATNPLWDVELDELNQQEAQERFRVTDKMSANWCLRKLQALQAKANEVNELAKAEIERITSWRDKELEQVNKHVEFFQGLLTEWHMQQYEADPKVNKSIKLPYGTLKSRTTKHQPSKLDEAALLEHVKATDEAFVKVIETVEWGEYKKTLSVIEVNGQLAVVDANGELVPGVAVKVGGTTFSVEVAE
ncbi:host-nuclease inhibitor Gam family protein [Alicyclobacillus suci]|uniref:host-nuclease inhibitor Gam family protein n=1 Tax=Alicyclobacillus suci TaxID=2816080 RepID=UPI001A8C1FD2|nr:host-nuclease inhibitor Gam family protein [Alicyclobacillus suci]